MAHVRSTAERILSDNPTLKIRGADVQDNSTQMIGRKKMRWMHAGSFSGKCSFVFSGDGVRDGKSQGIVLSGDTIFPGRAVG